MTILDKLSFFVFTWIANAALVKLGWTISIYFPIVQNAIQYDLRAQPLSVPCPPKVRKAMVDIGKNPSTLVFPKARFWVHYLFLNFLNDFEARINSQIKCFPSTQWLGNPFTIGGCLDEWHNSIKWWTDSPHNFCWTQSLCRVVFY